MRDDEIHEMTVSALASAYIVLDKDEFSLLCWHCGVQQDDVIHYIKNWKHEALLSRLFLNIEYRFNMVDAYLASNRGDYIMEAEYKCRALECERKIIVMGMNR